MAPKAAVKRKAEEVEEEAKKAAKKEEPKTEEDEAEKEKDAPADKRPTLSKPIGFYPDDMTLNVVPTFGGKVLMALSEGGMQYLIASARANVGLKAGRYMYEVKIIEALNPAEAASGTGRGRAPAPRQLVRLGFSTAGSSTILGDGEEHVFFDSEGFFTADKKKTASSQRFMRDQVMSVLLNLDQSSPNANTISIFREGERIAEPQKLPDSLIGKPLFPHVAFRNVTVQMLMGPASAKPLPFKCRMLSSAAAADAVVAKDNTPKDGKYEVVMPVAFPDEGTFDWVDGFLKKNPGYVELSDRKILDWAASSGVWKPKTTGWKNSNDKPEFNFGLPSMDDLSVRRLINNIAPVVPRNYLVMEVKENLVAEDRKETLKRFSAPHFKKVAHVVMGEPDEEYKKAQMDNLLKEKQEKANMAWRARKLEKERKKQLELRQKQLQEMRKKAAEEAAKRTAEAKKKADDAKKAAELEAKRKAAADAGEEFVEPAEEDAPMEEAKEEAKEEVKEEDEKKDEEMEEEEEEETEPPTVELTDEEKKQWFRPAGATTDLTTVVMGQSFTEFTIPNKDEGFDAVRYEWQKEKASNDYLKKWVSGKKVTARIEELQPGQWFQDTSKEWSKTFADWQTKQKAYKAEAAKKAAAKKAAEGEDAAEESKDDVDIASVTDVADVGEGQPLFKDFGTEDWALLQLRYELFLLHAAYKKDVDDPERVGVHESNLAFYYNKYFRKTMTPKYFGVTTNSELCDMAKDVAGIGKDPEILECKLAEEPTDLNNFVKRTEECRRERQRRIDAGDETAKLKISPLALQQPSPAQPKAGVGAPAAKATAWAPGGPRPAGAQWAGGLRPAGAIAPGGQAFGGKGAWPAQPQGYAPRPAWGKGGGKPQW